MSSSCVSATKLARASISWAMRQHSAEEFDLRFAKQKEICRGRRDGAVDGEDGDLEFVAGVDDVVAEYEAVGHVEPLNAGRARAAGGARQFPVDPDFRVVVDIDPQHCFAAVGIEAGGA